MKTNSPFNSLLTGIGLLICFCGTNLNAQPASHSNHVLVDIQGHKHQTASTNQLVELQNQPSVQRTQQMQSKQTVSNGNIVAEVIFQQLAASETPAHQQGQPVEPKQAVPDENTAAEAVSRPQEPAQQTSSSVSTATDKPLSDREKALIEREKALLEKEKILLEKEKKISVMEQNLLQELKQQEGSDAGQKATQRNQRINQIISDYFSTDTPPTGSVDPKELEYADAVNQQFAERSDNKQYTEEDIEAANRALTSGAGEKKEVAKLNITNKIVISTSATDALSRAGRIRQISERLVAESAVSSDGESSEAKDEQEDRYISQLDQEAAVREKESNTVEVKEGDSLWRIAKRIYGNGWLYTKIYRANPAIIDNPDLIYPGQLLRVPL